MPTRDAALMAAAASTPFAVEGSWHPDFGPSFTRIAGESVAYDATTDRFLVSSRTAGRPTSAPAATRSRPVTTCVFAFASFGRAAARASGPARVAPGGRATVRVDVRPPALPGPDRRGGTGRGRNRTVGGGHDRRGRHRRGRSAQRRRHPQAEKTGAGRSNRLSTSACRAATPPPPPGSPTPQPSAPDTSAPLGRILGIREGQRFRRGPRVLRGTVGTEPSGIKAVKLRLTRQVGKRCWYFSGSKERFLRRACGTRHAFKVGEQADWSYLLPSRLQRGRYVLDVIAMDRRRNRDVLERGRSRVVFHVR